MTVHCPHCSTGYLLPDHLVGAQGARVRCPSCQGPFVVLPEAGRGVAEPAEAPAEGPPGLPAGGNGNERPAADDPARLAAEILDRLAGELGEALERARATDTILSVHGPALLDAYDEFRRRSGASSAPSIFRASLRERWGLDLFPVNQGG